MPKTLISLFLKSSISVLSVLSTQLASAETTLVAVASNFIQPAQALVDAFNSERKTQHGHQARLVSGSSGKLYAQIIHGAPYDLFFSADQIKPQQLSDKGLTADNSQYTYAAGLLVFAVRVPDSM
ncbi:MAG: molybdate ABC transporter substrate-binding protein, partial [Thalassolituus sp.]